PPSASSDKPGPLPRIQTKNLDTGPVLASPLSGSPTDVRASTDTRESRPTSPHNVSSPRYLDGASTQNFLSVPGFRPRAASIESDVSPTSEFGGETQIESSTSGTYDERKNSFSNNDEIINDQDALKPDPGKEEDFKVEDNRFAFSPGQLNKMINPKSLAAFHALGGLAGLEKGLRTNRNSGLSVDELGLDGTVDFEEAVKAGAEEEEHFGTVKRTTTSHSLGAAANTSENSFADRRRIFKDNRLPEKKAKTFWQLAWIAYNDKVLILLSVAAVISLALGIYQTVRPAPSEEHEARVEWVEGVAIMVAIFVVTFVGALNDYQKERQFIKLNKKKEERFVKVIRSGKSREISVYDVLVGDVMHLEPGDLIPVDGVFIEGHNVRCDESSATGESDIIRKTPAEEVYHAIENHQNLKKMDPFILSGGKVSEGVGTFLVTSVGVNSSYGKTLMSLQDETQSTPLQSKLNVLAEYIAKLGLAAGLLLFVVLFIKFLVELKNIDGGAQAKGQRFLQIFIVAVTIVVVAVPEGLPLAVTLALAFATTRMLKDNNLVRLLRACETMGNATTVCSDKTGTLTQNKMSVVAGTLSTASRFGDKPPPANVKATGEGKLPSPEISSGDVSSDEFIATLSGETKSLLRDSVILNSTAFEGEEGGTRTFIGSKTETALLSFVTDHLAIESISEERSNADVVQMVPFDSGRKCMAVVIKLADGKYRMLVKGASEILIGKCSRLLSDPTTGIADAPITAEQIETLNAVQLLWVNLIMDTFAALALATDPPTKSILKRRPEPKSAPLITITMWKMIIGQSIYQLVVTLVLYFAGASILSYQTQHEKDALQSTIFNTFVWMQIFNQYNSRRLDNNFNIFEGVFKNYWFLGIQLIIIGGQCLIMFVGGAAFSIHRINGAQWGYSIVLGALSMPIAVVIRLLPDEIFAKMIPSIRLRKKRTPEFTFEDDDQLRQWNPALEEIREELTFLKKIRGGRMSELAYKLQHPRDAFMPRSRSPSRSRSNSDLPQTPDVDGSSPEMAPASPSTPEKVKKRARSTSNSVFGPAAAMAGIIAGSVAGGWSPVERRSEEPETIRFQRARSHSGVEGTSGMEIHPATSMDDPVFAENIPQNGIPPSQMPNLAPHFDHAPPHSSPGRTKSSHSRSTSSITHG
ncbi:plasma membrane calcium, partial [Exophiala xenobiotica]